MSSIPAAKERTLAIAETLAGLPADDRKALRGVVAELSRLEAENAKLLAVVRQVAALDGTKPPYVVIGRTVREAALLITKGGADV